MQIAKKAGHQSFTDTIGNVIVRVKASTGLESRPVLALQAHIDMVPQKNTDTVHDFEKDPILPRIVGDWVHATGTTLGADNGIGAAAMIAVMQSPQLAHGPLELIFTVDEEAGMGGAFGLEPGILTAKYLLNLDSEDDRDITIGCAGGIDATVSAPISYKQTSILEPVILNISLTGLKGGHSGIDIHLGRANANILLSEVILNLLEASSIELVRFQGGNMRNAIPREAFATIAFNKNNTERIISRISDFETELKSRFATTDPMLNIKTEIVVTEDKLRCLIKPYVIDFCSAIATAPNGVIDYEKDFPDVVQTSTNLSIAELTEDGMQVCLLLRSSSEDAKIDLVSDLREHFLKYVFSAEFSGEYPGWEPDADSEILAILKNSFTAKMSAEPVIKIIHAGLECGIIGSKYPDMQMVSFGPTIIHPHSPDEAVCISSVGKFWDTLLDFMTAI